MQNVTNKIFIATALLGFLFLLTACPYSADFPLDSPNQNVMKELIGKWEENGGSEKPTYFMIAKKTDKEYTFEKFEYKSDGKKYESTPYTAHFTKVGNIQFLNLKDKDAKYFFYKFEMGNDNKTITLYEVTDNIDETFGDATEMRAFFDKYKELSFFYNKDEKKYDKR